MATHAQASTGDHDSLILNAFPITIRSCKRRIHESPRLLYRAFVRNELSGKEAVAVHTDGRRGIRCTCLRASHRQEQRNNRGPRERCKADFLGWKKGYGSMYESFRLPLPHPYMHTRMFVSQPLCDTRPNWRHPVLKHTERQWLESPMLQGIPSLEERNGGRIARVEDVAA